MKMCMLHPRLDDLNESVNHSSVAAREMLKYGYTMDLVRVVLVLLEDA